MLQKIIPLILVCLAGILGVACEMMPLHLTKVVEPTSTSISSTPFPLTIRTPTSPFFTPTKTTTTIVSSNSSTLVNIPDGEYIIYSYTALDKSILGLISLDGSFQKDLISSKYTIEKISLRQSTWLVINGQHFQFEDLETMNSKYAPASMSCSSLDISPDEKTFIGSCLTSPDKTMEEIISFSQDGKLQQNIITNCSSKMGTCQFFSLSFDQKWFSYHMLPTNFDSGGANTPIGFYIAPYECITSSDGCEGVTIGPLPYTPYFDFWVANHPYLALLEEDGKYHLYEIKEKDLFEVHLYDQLLEKYYQKVGENYEPFLISENGSSLVFVNKETISLIDVASNEMLLLLTRPNLRPLIWIKIFDGKIVN